MYHSRLKLFFCFIILIAILGLAAYLIFPKLKNQNKNTQLALVDLSQLDSDSDGLSDKKEQELGTNLYNTDSDSDGYSDLEEVKSNHNPLVVESGNLMDDDGDGLTNEDERKYGTNPKNADSDYDGFPDGIEIVQGHDPKKTDLSTLTQLTSADASASNSVKTIENTLNAQTFNDVEKNLDALFGDKIQKKDYDLSQSAPEINSNDIKIKNETSKESVRAYINSVGILVVKSLPFDITNDAKFQDYILSFDPNDTQEVNKNLKILDDVYASLLNLEVPNDPEIIAWHKNLLSVFVQAKSLGQRWEEVRNDIYGVTKLFEQIQSLNSYCTDVLAPEIDRLARKYGLEMSEDMGILNQLVQ